MDFQFHVLLGTAEDIVKICRQNQNILSEEGAQGAWGAYGGEGYANRGSM